MEEFEQCPICCGTFSSLTREDSGLTPIVGVCGHTICRNCLVKMHLTKMETARGAVKNIKNLNCPLCHQPKMFRSDLMNPNFLLCAAIKKCHALKQEKQLLQQQLQNSVKLEPAGGAGEKQQEEDGRRSKKAETQLLQQQLQNPVKLEPTGDEGEKQQEEDGRKSKKAKLPESSGGTSDAQPDPICSAGSPSIKSFGKQRSNLSPTEKVMSLVLVEKMEYLKTASSNDLRSLRIVCRLFKSWVDWEMDRRIVLEIAPASYQGKLEVYRNTGTDYGPDCGFEDHIRLDYKWNESITFDKAVRKGMDFANPKEMLDQFDYDTYPHNRPILDDEKAEKHLRNTGDLNVTNFLSKREEKQGKIFWDKEKIKEWDVSIQKPKQVRTLECKTIFNHVFCGDFAEEEFEDSDEESSTSSTPRRSTLIQRLKEITWILLCRSEPSCESISYDFDFLYDEGKDDQEIGENERHGIFKAQQNNMTFNISTKNGRHFCLWRGFYTSSIY